MYDKGVANIKKKLSFAESVLLNKFYGYVSISRLSIVDAGKPGLDRTQINSNYPEIACLRLFYLSGQIYKRHCSARLE